MVEREYKALTTSDRFAAIRAEFKNLLETASDDMLSSMHLLVGLTLFMFFALFCFICLMFSFLRTSENKRLNSTGRHRTEPAIKKFQQISFQGNSFSVPTCRRSFEH